jgi:hypothetical protein
MMPNSSPIIPMPKATRIQNTRPSAPGTAHHSAKLPRDIEKRPQHTATAAAARAVGDRSEDRRQDRDGNAGDRQHPAPHHLALNRVGRDGAEAK